MSFDLLHPLVQQASTKILLVVADGLGGYASGGRGSELEEATTPNLDALAAEGSVGLIDPVGPGIIPGSGPAHMALFGYDPVKDLLGRGALSAAGLGFSLRPGDVAARANLATLDAEGRITDRRAGRLPDHEALEVVKTLMDGVHIDGVEITFAHEKQHRVLVLLRATDGSDLSPDLSDTDPQVVGVAPLPAMAETRFAAHTALVIAELDAQIRVLLAGHPCANVLLLRGWDTHRELPSMNTRYGVHPAALAIYPMYRGIGSLVGMEVLPPVFDIDEQVAMLGKHWDRFDFFFFHHKDADSCGEDGNFEAKVDAIERLDRVMPDLVALEPDVLVVTGDHATPSQWAAHSWHPVPVLMWGERVGRDPVTTFGESAALGGALGRRPTNEIMPIMLAASGRLAKYGA